jgi:hypothetical protein
MPSNLAYVSPAGKSLLAENDLARSRRACDAISRYVPCGSA